MAVSQSQPQTRLVKRVAAFTGDGTWTVPAGVTYAIAHVLGGGGGIGDFNALAGYGGTSTVEFGGSVGDVDGLGGSPSGFNQTMAVANAGPANSGRGATGYPTDRGGNGPGNAQWIVAGSPVTPAASITVTVGAGGSAGGNGAIGGSGYVYIEYYEEVFV